MTEVNPELFKSMVRASFFEACRKQGIKPTEALFERAIAKSGYFQRKMQKLEVKQINLARKPITRAVQIAVQQLDAKA